MSVRIGFVGAGGIAGAHLANLVNLPAAEVVALADLSKERVAATQERVNQRIAQSAKDAGKSSAGLPKLDAAAYDDYRLMIRQERLDALYICLPPFAHGEPEEAAIEAGLPMMVEKPVGLTLPVAARLYAKIKERGLIAAAGYQLRYGTPIQKARELLQGRTIGMAVVMRYGSTPGTPWYHRQEKSGGQLIEMATHETDMLRYLVGDIKSVYSAAATRINHKENPEYNIFDVNAMTLTFDNGAVGNFSNNFICKHGSPAESRGIHVMGENITVSIALGRAVKVVTPEGTEEFPYENNPMTAEDEAFVNAVAGNRPELIRSDYENGVRTLAVTLAADHSAQTGQPVDVREYARREAPEIADLWA